MIVNAWGTRGRASAISTSLKHLCLSIFHAEFPFPKSPHHPFSNTRTSAINTTTNISSSSHVKRPGTRHANVCTHAATATGKGDNPWCPKCYTLTRTVDRGNQLLRLFLSTHDHKHFRRGGTYEHKYWIQL